MVDDAVPQRPAVTPLRCETCFKRGHSHPDRPDTLRSTTKGTMSLTSIPPEAIGYVYRTDCPSADWWDCCRFG